MRGSQQMHERLAPRTQRRRCTRSRRPTAPGNGVASERRPPSRNRCLRSAGGTGAAGREARAGRTARSAWPACGLQGADARATPCRSARLRPTAPAPRRLPTIRWRDTRRARLRAKRGTGAGSVSRDQSGPPARGKSPAIRKSFCKTRPQRNPVGRCGVFAPCANSWSDFQSGLESASLGLLKARREARWALHICLLLLPMQN